MLLFYKSVSSLPQYDKKNIAQFDNNKFDNVILPKRVGRLFQRRVNWPQHISRAGEHCTAIYSNDKIRIMIILHVTKGNS